MRHLLSIVIALISVLTILSGCVANKELDLVVEEGHSIENLLASYGCVRYETEPFSIWVNGKEIVCDLDLVWNLCAKDMARIQKSFEGKLNNNSKISQNWLVLRDQYDTLVAHVRVGSDPFGFFPDLPTASFYNRGNLTSLTSYDINDGYYRYEFRYDSDDKIIYAEERCNDVSLKNGQRSKNCSCVSREWRYSQNGNYLLLTKRWDEILGREKLKTIFFQKFSDGFPIENENYQSEKQFHTDKRIQTEWNEGTETVEKWR